MFKINNQHEDILQSVGMNDHPVPLEIRKKLVNLHLQSALVTWQIQNHLPQTIDSRELTGEYIKLFQDNEVFFQVLTGKSLGDRQLWKKAYILARFYLSSALQGWLDDTSNLFLDFRFKDGEQTLTGSSVKRGLLNRSRTLRENFFCLRHQRGEKLAALLVLWLPVIDREAKASGFADYLELRCFENEMSREQVSSLLASVKNLSTPFKRGVDPVDVSYRIKQLESLTATPLIGLNPGGALKLLGKLVPEVFKEEFKSLRFYWGVPLKRLTRYKGYFIKKSGKQPRRSVETAFCLPVQIPGDIRIQLPDRFKPVNGLDAGYSGLKTLFHEIGHGLHFASMVNGGPGDIYHVTEPNCFKEAAAKLIFAFFLITLGKVT